MEKIIVLSRCTYNSGSMAEFHFKGFLYGEEIKTIKVRFNPIFSFVKDSDYILYLEILNIRKSCLTAKCLKAKDLGEF